ncbi:hypothetical protein PORY_001546 [Pneumocystis oryctolagi]|uniref:Uncharacterized protein n=1 Tax=Pneumocystis oryctolagi TaxID=42067 RepID=A0ACB7CBE0_9ASCO|nr:hypothetical protein PORY_001546 [Pneumocystis oryctolagi]
MSSKRARGSAGNKLKMTLGLPGTGARLNRLPASGVGDMVLVTVKKGKPELRKKVMPAIIVRQRKPWRRYDGLHLYFEDNAGVIVNPKGEMKGSTITGPVGKECADLWPRIASNSMSFQTFSEPPLCLTSYLGGMIKYCYVLSRTRNLLKTNEIMVNNWDCIIVGAGILGAPLATVLGRQQRQILLLERDLSEPDRIVGELLQPGGVAALKTLKLEDALEEIDAIRVNGYHLIWNDQHVNIPYESYGIALGGRSFHHGRFVQRLRQQAQAQRCVQLLEATAVEVIEDKETGHILGVVAREKATGKLEQYFASLVIIADGCFSTFRKQFITKKVVTKSNFVGLLLKNVILPMPLHGHVILSKHSPILIYQLSTHHTRILIDIPGKLPSNSTGELKKYLEEVIIPILPKSLRLSFAEALESQRIRSMPNCFLPPSLNTKPGLIVLGDAMNMRHPLTGGGMTVALNDVLLLSKLLSPMAVPSFQDTNLVLRQMHLFHWKHVLQRGCFQYFKLGGPAINGPIGLLSGYIFILSKINKKPRPLTMYIRSQTAAVDRFKCLWTSNKHQVRKRWHDGFLHFHRFNFRAMLYDEENTLVDDLFMPKQSVISGDQIEFDHHLVSVEDALDTIYTDISSLYVRNRNPQTDKNTLAPYKQQYTRKPSKQLKQSFQKKLVLSTAKSRKKASLFDISGKTRTTNISSVHTKTQKIIVEEKVKEPAIIINNTKKLLLKQNNAKQEDISTKDIHEIFISDDEAYDLFSQ